MLEKKTLTTGEVAKHCGVHFRTVIRWIEKGHLKAYQLPGRGDNRVTLEDFLNFLQKNHIPVPEELQGHSAKILIVDDEIRMAHAIERVLKKEGCYDTQIATDAFQAGVFLGTYAPAVITLDLMMPSIGGIETLNFIRSREEARSMKILVISAAPQKLIDEALQSGADDFLVKPFENGELIEKVALLMKKKTPS
ncbi:MAG: response regulator [Deltaproteobacteria bacterium]|nr:response regulator [Deltaproteobacteria bacterium]